MFNGGKFNGESATISGTINGATIVTSGTLTANKIISTSSINGTTISLSSGANTGYVLTSDASGNATWQDLATLASNGDNLGTHTATQDLNMAIIQS